jgi:hypothetical protein
MQIFGLSMGIEGSVAVVQRSTLPRNRIIDVLSPSTALHFSTGTALLAASATNLTCELQKLRRTL